LIVISATTVASRSYSAPFATLRDLAGRTNNSDFGQRIDALREMHARKPTFIDRLNKAGL
jgi:hypothetical protein